MATKAADQVTIIDITDGYSAGLTSEAFTFVGNTSGATSGLSCTTQAFMFCGSTACSAVTIGTITNPTGISSEIANNGTANPTITFKTTAVISAACEATIPITADGVTINKKFSFAVAKTGATGAKGDSVSITSKVVDYQVGDSGTTPPTGSWSTSVPEVATGKYLWTRTTVTYNGSNGSTVSYAVSYQGVDGTSPEVKTTVNEYQQSSSGTAVPTGTWSTTPPTATAGQYMWTRTTTTYTDGKTAVGYSVSKNGTNGTNGANAIRVEITSSGGMVFKNNSGEITLTAHVYSGTTEATVATNGAVTGATTGTIKWYKGDPGTDSSLTAVATAKTLTISASDVLNAQLYTCRLE